LWSLQTYNTTGLLLWLWLEKTFALRDFPIGQPGKVGYDLTEVVQKGVKVNFVDQDASVHSKNNSENASSSQLFRFLAPGEPAWLIDLK
jgi:hypothetical protein